MDPSSYGAALGAMAGGGGPPPTVTPGGPPPPSMTGKMETGDPSTTPRVAASSAIMALRALQGHFPSMQPNIEGMIAQIQDVVKAPGAAPGGAPAGAPAMVGPPSMPPPMPGA